MTAKKFPSDRWNVKPLGEVCKTIKGKKPKNTGPLSTERTVPYINIKAFESGQPEEFAAPGDYPTCERNDVLVVWDGARAGLSGLAVPGYIGSTLAKVHSDVTSNLYLFYFLQSQYGPINSRTKGVGIPHIDPLIFNNIPFPIAPKDQQDRIVAEIEKQFSRLDEAVSNLRRVKANLKRHKAAVLKAAVEGKLTEDWRMQHPNVESASKLLERILVERREKWIGKGKCKEPAVPDTPSLPLLPSTWAWSSLETVCSDIVDCPHSTPKWESTGRICLRTTEFRPGRLDLTNVRFVSQVTYEKRIQRLRPSEGDILYSREGGILGVACMIPKGIDPCLGQRMMLMRTQAEYAPNLLMHWLNSSWILSRVRSLTGGSASPHLNVGEVKMFPVPLVPVAEQKQIVAEVERRLSFIDGLEIAVQAQLTRANRLRESILSRAFEADLSLESFEPLALQKETSMKTRDLPLLPAQRESIAEDKRVALTEVLSRYPKGLPVETLFVEAGYQGDQIDQFYRDLSVLAPRIDQEVPLAEGAVWPYSGFVNVRLKS